MNRQDHLVFAPTPFEPSRSFGLLASLRLHPVVNRQDHLVFLPFCAYAPLSLCPFARAYAPAMAKHVSMQEAVKSIRTYVASMTALLSSEEAVGVAAEQAKQAVSIITTCKTDPVSCYNDGNSALSELSVPDCPWTSEQKAQIAAAIRMRIEGSRVKSGDQQENDFLHNYLPHWLWLLIQSHCLIDHVFEHMATFCVATLKLRNPSEPARRSLVALVCAARNMSPSPDDALQLVEKLRQHFDAARAIHTGSKGPLVYPADPSMFVSSSVDCAQFELPLGGVYVN